MKTINPFTATLAAALLLGGAPALASASGMPSGPVKLDSVQFNQAYTPDQTFDPGMATIAFTNTGSVPATDVVFAVTSNGNIVDAYDASGSFAPGVTVSKAFPSAEPASDQNVVVQSVTYADGSVWSNPDVKVVGTTVTPAAQAPASSAPAPAANPQ
jgi:hypothetical protein